MTNNSWFRLKRGTRRVAALGAVSYAAFFLAGCGGAGATVSTTQGQVAPAVSQSSAPQAQAGIPAGARVERSADITLEVKPESLDTTLDKVFGVMREFSGYVSGSRLSSDSAGVRTGTVSFRVPSNHFEDAIGRIRALGAMKTLNVGGNDVTGQYIDLSARLRNQEAQEQALLALLNKASSVQDTVNIQNQLAQVRDQVERLKGQVAFIDSQVDYSSINVVVNSAGVGVTPGGDEWGFRTAAIQSAHYAVNALNVTIVVLGAGSPVIVIGLLGVFVLRRMRIRLPMRPQT